MTLEKFFNYFTSANTMELLLAFLIAMVILTLVQATRNPNDEFDLKDLISTDGKLNEKKFTRFGAWVLSSWGFVYILVNNPKEFPEWYFVGYMAAWVVNAIWDKYVENRNTDK